MQAYLLDDFKVEIDPRTAEIGGCWQGKPRDGIPTVWGMDELRFFYERTLEYEQPVILDIGANTGAFSVLAVMNPAMRSYAFEPATNTYAILNRNISLNRLHDKIKTFQIALSDRNGKVVLKYPKSGKDSGLACIGEPLRFDEWIEFKVETSRLDDFATEHGIEKVDLIKIDTEGCELFVLKGAEELIKKCSPGIFCEYNETNAKQFGYHSTEIVKLLTSWGYKYAKVSHEDMYFYHSERVSVTKPRIITSPSRAFELPGKPPHNQSVTSPSGFEVFDCQAAIEINKARQGHLASLGLELAQQSVLEVGSGVGLHTSFFEELGCKVLSTDARPENVAEHLRRYPYRKVEVADLIVPDSHKRFGEFDIIYCYGTLYHLSNPSLCIKELSSVCRKFFLIETCVSPVDNGEINPTNENRRNPNQSIEGIGCRPSREWVMAELKKYFPFVYVTTTQPDHHEFPLNWPAPVKGRVNTRSVFVASKQSLNLPTLSTELPKTQKRLSAVPVSKIQQDNQEKFLDKTLKQLATEKYTNRELFREWISKAQETGQSGNITIFAIPRQFVGHIGLIQRNAIKSWTLLEPRPEIILFGDDDGVAEVAEEFGLRHIPSVKRNSYGTPLINDMFDKAQAIASNNILAYVNSDIILLNDFMPAVEMVAKRFNEFLMIEQRWDTDISEPIDFEDADWEKKLRQFVRQNASLHAVTGVDCFVFTKCLWSVIPPFGIGRTMWDIWLVREALLCDQPSVDASKMVTIVHQNHDFSHIPGGTDAAIFKTEVQRNLALGGNDTSWGYTSQAIWELRPDGIVLRPVSEFLKERNPSIALKCIESAYHQAPEIVKEQCQHVKVRTNPDYLSKLLSVARKELLSGPAKNAAKLLLISLGQENISVAGESFRKGFRCLRNGDASEAIKYLEKAAKNCMTLPNLHYALAAAYAELGDILSSKKACEIELSLQPDNDGARRLLERIKKAIAEYNQLPSSSTEVKV
jgi:FkbM family methyltransferase